MDLRPKILMYETMHSKGTELLEKKCDLVYADSLEEKRLTHLASDVEAIIIRANGAVTEEIIEAAPKLKVIGRHGVGLDAIDLAAAKKRGVRVVYTPQANKESVAEHFVALAIMLAKKIRLADMALRDCNWQARYELIGTELKLDNFVGTPHMSAHTEEAMVRMTMVAKDVLCCLEGKAPEYPFLAD